MRHKDVFLTYLFHCVLKTHVKTMYSVCYTQILNDKSLYLKVYYVMGTDCSPSEGIAACQG